MKRSNPGGQDRGFEPIDHTADVGLRIWGRTLEELYEQAALGMVALLVDPAHVEARAARSVTIDAGDAEEVLIAWLQEILYLYEVGRFIPSRVRVVSLPGGGVEGVLFGETVDRGRHEVRSDLKAATYSGLTIRRVGGAGMESRWETTVIFDI